MITDYFLKFASKQEAVYVFSTIPLHTHKTDSNEVEVTTQTETFAIDEVGILYENDGVYSSNLKTGEIIVLTPPTRIEGYHYNYRTLYGNKPEIPLPLELEPYLVTPEIPQRTFF